MNPDEKWQPPDPAKRIELSDSVERAELRRDFLRMIANREHRATGFRRSGFTGLRFDKAPRLEFLCELENPWGGIIVRWLPDGTWFYLFPSHTPKAGTSWTNWPHDDAFLEAHHAFQHRCRPRYRQHIQKLASEAAESAARALREGITTP